MRFLKSYYFTLFLSFVLTINGFSQIDHNPVNRFIYDEVSRNLYAYNLRYASPTYNGIRVDEVLESEGMKFYDPILPSEGTELIMTIDSSDLVYPISKYKVYKIFIPNFQFLDTTHHQIIRTTLAGLKTKDFLVAVDFNREFPSILFISGQFYPTRILPDFGVNFNDPKSFLEYLHFRTYSNQLKSIQFKKTEGNSLIFTGYSQKMESNVKIIVKKDDLERPEVIKE